MRGVLVPALVLFASCSTATVDAVSEHRAHDRANHPGGIYQRNQARRSADGTIPANALLVARAWRDAMVQARPESIGSVQWTWLGPGNVGGRVRAVVIHPTNAARLWCATAGGGVWRTDDGGTSWQPMNDFLAALGCGCLVLDPADPDHLFLGSGEGFFDAPEGSSNTAFMRGAGIWQSFDAGVTWTQIPSTAGADFSFVNRLAFAPGNPNVMLAATGSGIWRSSDAGATWSRRTTVRSLDVDFHPSDASRAVAGQAEGFAQYSTDGGLTWSNAGSPPQSTRVELAYARSSPQTVYACVTNTARNQITVWRSTDGGQSYVQRSTAGTSTLSLYLSCLWVDPTNANNVIYGGQSLLRSTDGGVTGSTMTSGGHADYHVVVEHPGYNGTTQKRVYTGNDGGVHTRADWQSGSWTELNNNLGVTQFYGAAMNPTTGVMVAGAQDNGTNRYNGGTETWTLNVIGGDGGFCAADQQDPAYFYGESQYLGLARSSNGGANWTNIRGATTGDPGFNFIPYIMLDPNDQNRMLACGRALWRTNNVKSGTPPTWTQIKAPRSCSTVVGGDPPQAHFLENPPCNLSTCAVALGNPNVIWVGHNDGEVHRTANGTAAAPTWTQVDGGTPGLPDRWVSSIAIDPTDHAHVVVSLMGYATPNVFATIDHGSSWQPIAGSGAAALPAVPVTWVVMHPRVPAWLFAATDLGLFCSDDAGQHWQPVDGGPENVAIDQLAWKNDRELLVVTHGRGVWIAALPMASVAAVGSGCAVGAPAVLTASPPIVGATQTWTMTGARANALVWFGYSFGAPVPQTFGSCVVQIDLANAAPYAAGATSGTGTWTTPLVIPPIAALAGAPLVAQALILGAGGPLLGAGDLSNGVQLVLGF